MASKEYNPADTAKQTGAISAIEIFQPLIIRAVNAEELIASSKLKQIIGDDVVKGLRRSKTPNDQRVNTILELISQSTSLDKWKTFAGVLTDCDFTFVPLVIIKHYSSSVELHLNNVVDKLKDETVDTALLSGILKTNSLLTDIDVQDIDTERINRQCEKAALLVLIDRVVTFHPDSWYQNFLKCLCEAGMEGAVKKIEPDFGTYETMSDTKHNNEMESVTTDDHWRKLIMELCYGQIVKNVTPTGLLTNLGSVFNMDEKTTIRSCQKTESSQAAMAKLLNILDKKDCQGKWQIFKQALFDGGYAWIKDFIEGNFICYGDSDNWELMINFFEGTLSEKIRPQEILPYLRQENIISDIDSQEVEQVCRNSGENEAVFRLLTFLPKRKPNSWYPEFMEILFKTGCEETVGEIDPDIYKELIRNKSRDTSASEEISNNSDIDSLKEGADKNMDESDIKENYVSVTEDPETAGTNLCSEQNPSNLNTDKDDEITKQKLLAKTKVDQSYNMLSDPEAQPDSGQTELNSIIVENAKREIAREVSHSEEDKRNIECSQLIRNKSRDTSASEEISNNSDIDSLKEGADKNMDESDIKENYVSVTEEAETALIDLCSEQNPIDLDEVRDRCSRTMSNLNIDIDDEITKQKLLSKTKVEQSYNILSESQTQPESGQAELNSIIVENTKREIAHEVTRSKEDNRNIVCSLQEDERRHTHGGLNATNDGNEYGISFTNNNLEDFRSSVDENVRCMLHLGNDCYVVAKTFRGILQIHIRYYYRKEGKLLPTKRGVVLNPSEWLKLEANCDTLDKLSEQCFTGELKKKEEICLGGDVYLSVNPKFRIIDIRHWKKSVKTQETYASRKGVSLNRTRWNSLKDVMTGIRNKVPELSSA